MHGEKNGGRTRYGKDYGRNDGIRQRYRRNKEKEEVCDEYF
jgi:hypothetical protein